jgi:ribonuclease VapC
MDASALLALARGERGAEIVADYLDSEQCVISSVNMAEVGSKLVDLGLPASELNRALKQFNIDVIDLGFDGAVCSAAMRSSTREYGLSLGDRTCLALAQELKATAITSDRAWQALEDVLNVKIVQIR